jgi:hypothetical protein
MAGGSGATGGMARLLLPYKDERQQAMAAASKTGDDNAQRRENGVSSAKYGNVIMYEGAGSALGMGKISGVAKKRRRNIIWRAWRLLA